MVKLFAVKTLCEDHFRQLVPMFSPDKRIEELLHRGKNKLAAQHNILSYLLMRKVLISQYPLHPNEIVIAVNEHSKPYLSGKSLPHFNLSHSGEWVVGAFSEKPIGIDIEKIKRVNLKVAERFFSLPEIRFLNELNEVERDLWFLKFWTIKESYLKALGTGLSRSMSSFVASYHDGVFHITDDENPEKIFLDHRVFEQNYLVSVSAYEPDIQNEIVIYDVTNLIA